MVKNIRLVNPNMSRIGSYFYSFNEETDVMIQKADDGTLAFSYPLDTALSSNEEITSLEYDGESFWTMGNIDGTPANGFRIRRWVIDDFVMVLQQTFEFESGVTDTFESQAFTIEHYEGTLVSGAVENTSTFSVSFATDIFALLTPGTTMFIGPSSKAAFVGQSQRVTVNSTGSGNVVTVSAPLTVGFVAGDLIVFSKNIWFFNDHYLTTTDAGGLYKINSLDGGILNRTQNAIYTPVNAATFHELDSFTGSLATHNKPYLVFLSITNLLFVDVFDSNLPVSLSSLQNNINSDTITVNEVYDIGIEGETIFRLQKKFNINGSDTSENTYNYQLASFAPFPTAIALTATPALLPADSGASNSAIVATVTDQYLLPFVTSPSSTIIMSTSGGGTGATLTNLGAQALNSDGQAFNTYRTGDAAGLVTISATVTIN
jgi:hypothetical protein